MLAGFVAGAAAGFLAAPDVIAVPGLLALLGLALGLLVGLLVSWWHASEPAADRQVAAEPALAADRQVADEAARWPPAPPHGDRAPGWHPDPRDSSARRYWDGESWTEHLWRDRERPGRAGSAPSAQ